MYFSICTTDLAFMNLIVIADPQQEHMNCIVASKSLQGGYLPKAIAPQFNGCCHSRNPH